ncbi:MAG: hypothetical protein LBH05_01660 [Deferribacteraceae bacterium]|jgi:hypothetical protein|nr:hypothetical protein [Deferribacteraceae bacterium]
MKKSKRSGAGQSISEEKMRLALARSEGAHRLHRSQSVVCYNNVNYL